MGDDLASANVNRTYSLGATSLAIFTFTMLFLYPRYVSGEADPLIFQATVIVMGIATFALVMSSLHYYGSSLGDRFDEPERARYARRADQLWLLGATLLFLEPSLVLLTIGLVLVAAVWFALWVVYLAFVSRSFPLIQTRKR